MEEEDEEGGDEEEGDEEGGDSAGGGGRGRQLGVGGVPVEVVECVRDARRHLHPRLRGQLLDGRVALRPEGLRVVLVRQPADLPLLGEPMGNQNRGQEVEGAGLSVTTPSDLHVTHTPGRNTATSTTGGTFTRPLMRLSIEQSRVLIRRRETRFRLILVRLRCIHASYKPNQSRINRKDYKPQAGSP